MPRGGHAHAPRRGVAALVVILLVSIALALSYAVMRSQATAVQIHRNAVLGASARQAAAMAAARGMDLAIRRMKTTQWQGVDVPFAQSLSANERFEVTFTTGDDSLAAADPAYAEWPYRVTLKSTGYASDPENPRLVAAHSVRAVVRLIPRAVANPLPGWGDIKDFTVYQWTSGEFSITVPFRVEGAARIRDAMDLTEDELKWHDDERQSYLEGLNGLRTAAAPVDSTVVVPAMPTGGSAIQVQAWRAAPGAAVQIGTPLVDLRVGGTTVSVVAQAVGSLKQTLVAAGATVTVGQSLGLLSIQPDWRPFSGPIDLSNVSQRADTAAMLDAMAVKRVNTTAASLGWAAPTSLTSYRLYAGGKSYSVPALAGSLSNTVLEPDPKTNPLGLFVRDGACQIRGNVTLRGTLVTTGGASSDIEVSGTNNQVLPYDLPPYNHPDIPAAARIRLPAIVTADDFIVDPGTQLSLNGMLLCTDRFLVSRDWQYGISLAIQGKLLAKDVSILRRLDWPDWDAWWQVVDWAFDTQKDQANGIRYFPEWLRRVYSLDPAPRMVVRPDPTPVSYYCQISSNSLFVPSVADGGLRWELVAWSDAQ